MKRPCQGGARIAAGTAVPTCPRLPDGAQPHGCTPLVARYDGTAARFQPLRWVLRQLSDAVELLPRLFRGHPFLCSWCGVEFGTAPPRADGRRSHGICPTCAEHLVEGAGS